VVNLDTVLIDKPGNRLSLEREIRGMATLFLLDRGFLVAEEEGNYTAEIQAREREYSQGWNTRRSLSLEIRFWRKGEEGGSENRNTPLAAGRVTTQGERTLSSSKIVSRMLKAAVRKAVRALPKTLKTEALP
jgi:hypothetical protein